MTTQSFEEIRRKAALARKTAKSTREEWKESEPSAARDKVFKQAVEELDALIQALESWRKSAFDREAIREIGDCLGAKGGTLRDWGKYDEAVKAYDDGWPIEQEVEEKGGSPNSYCLVQRLVMRVLWEPDAYKREEKILEVDVHEALKSSVNVVQKQMDGLRKGDPWAQADIALQLQLLGGQAYELFGDNAALTAWDELDDMRPDRFVYKSTCEVVTLLQKRLAPLLSDEDKESWADVASRLG